MGLTLAWVLGYISINGNVSLVLDVDVCGGGSAGGLSILVLLIVRCDGVVGAGVGGAGVADSAY